MAVGDGSRYGRKLDDGSSVIDKRYYGRSRKKRVQPAPEDEPDMDLPPPANTAELPELPASPAAATSKENPEELPLSPGAVPSTATAMSPPDPQAGPSDCHSSSSSPPSPSPSVDPDDSHRGSFQEAPSSTTLKRSDATAATASKSSEGDPESYSDRRSDRRRRRPDSDDSPPTLHQPNRRRSRVRDGSRPAHHDTWSTRNTRSRSLEEASSTTATECSTSYSRGRSSDGSSSSSSGRSSSDGSYSGTESSTEEESRKRRYRTNKRHSSRSRYRKHGSKNRHWGDRSREGGRSGRYRGDRHPGRRYSRHRTKERTITGRGRRRGSTSHRGTGSRGGRRRRRRHRSRDSGEDRMPREDRSRSRRKNGRRRKSDRHDGYRDHRRRSRPSDAHKTRHGRAGGGATGARGGLADVRHSQSTPLPAGLSVVATGEGTVSSYAEALLRREELRELTVKAAVNLQRFARGFVARNRVAGRREAIALLRSACFGAAIDVIDGYIREDVAPGMISDILADGFEGGAQAERQRAEAAAEAHGILEETTTTMIGGLVAMAVTEEADSHLDIVFVRDRRNPLLRTVDDVIADTLRICIREGVVEVVKECAEEFMFDRRIFAIVEGLLEDGVMKSVRPIASEVYEKAIGHAVYVEVMEELCAEEGRSVVAETMAPFEDQLVELQREKDVAAIQATALSVMVKGLQLQHAARTVGQRGRLVVMSDINGKTLNLLLAGRFLAILRAAEANRLRVSTSPLLFTLFRRLVVRTGRSVLLEELSRELDRDETALHALELERIDEVDRQRLAARGRAVAAELPRQPKPS